MDAAGTLRAFHKANWPLSRHLIHGKSTPVPCRADTKKATTLDQRKHARYLVEYTGAFLGEGITASGIILNLSVAGCRARSERTFGSGELLQVLIDVPRYQTPLQVECAMVRWSNGHEFGMEFLGSPLDHQQRLRELIRAVETASRNG